jgi:uncharacterized protein
MDALWDIALGFWTTLGQMAPYLLFGFLFAGVLSVLISPSAVERHLGGSGLRPVAKAAIFGVPLPLCSCGVIPVTASLRRHGASRPASTSFLLSTPQTGVDSILVTYSLLGPVFAVFRPIAALISGLLGGALVAIAGENGNASDVPDDACTDECCSNPTGSSTIVRILRYGLVTLPRDIGRALIVGLVLAGVISALVPDDFFAGWLGGGISSMLAMMLVGIPIYVCATASVPVAAALVAKGVSAGAVLVFLMTGPATNAAAIATIWRVMGRRTALVYLAVVAITALASGLVLDQLYSASGSVASIHSHEMGLSWLETGSAVALIIVLAVALLRPEGATTAGADTESAASSAEQTTTLTISGMTCNHCVQSVQRTLLSCTGVSSVEVRLKSGQARVSGTGYDPELLRRSVQELGFGASLASGATQGSAL